MTSLDTFCVLVVEESICAVTILAIVSALTEVVHHAIGEAVAFTFDQ